MADMIAPSNQERTMRVAVDRIVGFAKQFGEAHLNLACHAAFPLVLTPDLLYQIWAHFAPEAPWTAVARVLLSRLCRQVGYEMYEMDIAVRNLLLKELKEQFGRERLDELAEFLMDYVAQQLTGDDSDTQNLRDAQEWTALSYTRPDEVASELAETLRARVKQEDMAEVFRLASLVETFAEPLVEAGFEPLLIYSRGMSSCVRGDLEGATVQFSKLQEQENQVEIAGVSLDIPLEPHSIFSKKTPKGTPSVYRPPGREPLTEAQQQLYDWLVKYILISQHAPSIREMMRAMNLSNPAVIQSRLEHLRAKGYIDWTEGKAHTIRILGDSTGGVPILGVVGNDLVEPFIDVVEYLDLSSLFHQPGNFALRVVGDSMKEYLIAEGDVVIMRPVPDPNQLKNGLIVAARFEGHGTTVRRFYRTDDRVKLEPGNSKYAPIEVSISQVQIQGVVVGVWREQPSNSDISVTFSSEE